MILVAGCGSVVPDGSAPDASVPADAAGMADAAVPDPDSCDPVSNTGCADDEKCSFLVESESPLTGRTTCVPAGNVPPGGACTRGPAGETGYDNCAGNASCVAGTCQEICLDEPDSCSVENEACFLQPPAYSDREGVGLCLPSCDPVAQDCPAGEGCYLDAASGDSACATPVTESGMQGDDCQFQNACQIGYGCVLNNDPVAPTGLSCAFFCDAGGGGGRSCADGPGPTFTCVRISEFYADSERVPDEIGMCIDCATWQDVPGCP